MSTPTPRKPATRSTTISRIRSSILEGREDALALLQDVAEVLASQQDAMESVPFLDSLVPWFRASIGMDDREHFAVVYLDQARRVVGRKVYPAGSTTRTTLYPRQLFKDALEVNATGMVLAHNHPSSTMAFSGADLNLTKRIADVGASLEVELIEHFIVSRTGFISARATGLL